MYIEYVVNRIMHKHNQLIIECKHFFIMQTNTFQCILVTENIRSYAIFLYADGLIQWPSSGAQVGFNAGDNMTYVNVPGSRTPSILNITQMSNVGIGGQWVFQTEKIQGNISLFMLVFINISCFTVCHCTNILALQYASRIHLDASFTYVSMTHVEID